jgi:hypothetical protein
MKIFPVFDSFIGHAVVTNITIITRAIPIFICIAMEKLIKELIPILFGHNFFLLSTIKSEATLVRVEPAIIINVIRFIIEVELWAKLENLCALMLSRELKSFFITSTRNASKRTIVLNNRSKGLFPIKISHVLHSLSVLL